MLKRLTALGILLTAAMVAASAPNLFFGDGDDDDDDDDWDDDYD
ncbi:hypothetical protein [Sphaerisporangium aureirubrum]|uniref:DNA primase n=1 Tax=Sphaerisporangium aureirubrum TaxID=1544736 RepID=A0ABW1NPC6_9ACTN